MLHSTDSLSGSFRSSRSYVVVRLTELRHKKSATVVHVSQG